MGSDKRTVVCPTQGTAVAKTSIVEQPKEVKEPQTVLKKIEEPYSRNRVKKHGIRMIVIRRKKMKKHQLKKLWDRMYLKFRTDKVAREKKKEYAFRGRWQPRWQKPGSSLPM